MACESTPWLVQWMATLPTEPIFHSTYLFAFNEFVGVTDQSHIVGLHLEDLPYEWNTHSNIYSRNWMLWVFHYRQELPKQQSTLLHRLQLAITVIPLPNARSDDRDSDFRPVLAVSPMFSSLFPNALLSCWICAHIYDTVKDLWLSVSAFPNLRSWARKL